MNTKNIVIGVLVALTLTFGVIAFKNPTVISIPTQLSLDASKLGSAQAPVVNVPAPIVNVAAPNVSVNVPRQSSPVLGSVTGPDLPSPYFQYGGVRTWQYRSVQTSLASTSCSIPAPFATSTVFASFGISVIGSTSPAEIGWSAGPMATTTLIAASSSVATANPFPVTSSSTATTFTTFQNFIVPPSRVDANGNISGSFINYKIGGGVGFTAVPTAVCTATFRETN